MHIFLVFGIQNVIFRNSIKGRKRDDKIPLSTEDQKDKMINNFHYRQCEMMLNPFYLNLPNALL